MSKDLIKQEDEGLPPWLRAMREAVREAITAEDVKGIVRKQVEKAKAGDQAAIKFVFDHVLGGNQLKGATIIQNNFQGAAEDPRKPTNALPGSQSKLDKMKARAAAGLPLCDPKDHKAE